MRRIILACLAMSGLLVIGWCYVWPAYQVTRDPSLKVARQAREVLHAGMSVKEVLTAIRPFDDPSPKGGVIVTECPLVEDGQRFFGIGYRNGVSTLQVLRRVEGVTQVAESMEFADAAALFRFLEEKRPLDGCRQMSLGFGIWDIVMGLDALGRVRDIAEVGYQG